MNRTKLQKAQAEGSQLAQWILDAGGYHSRKTLEIKIDDLSDGELDFLYDLFEKQGHDLSNVVRFDHLTATVETFEPIEESHD